MSRHEELVERYRFYSDTYLAQMWADVDDLAPDAVAALREVIAEREVDADLPEPLSLEEREEMALGVASSGGARRLWGFVLCMSGLLLAAGSGGAVFFLGLVVFGAALWTSGHTLANRAEQMRAEIATIRTELREREMGQLSLPDGEGGSLSEPDPRSEPGSGQ